MATLDFMARPLAQWIQLFNKEEITSTDLLDGIFLTEVLQQLDTKSTVMMSLCGEGTLYNLNSSSNDKAVLRERIKTWQNLINCIQQFYEVELRHHIVMKLPDIFIITKEGSSLCDDAVVVELEKTLLLLLGVAVHCERKELYIEQITGLDVLVQHVIVDYIKDVTENYYNVLPVIDNFADHSARVLYEHVLRLIREQQETNDRVLDQVLLVDELSRLNEEHSSRVVNAPLSPPVDSVQLASSGGSNVTAAINRHQTAAEHIAQIRKLRRELDEKNEDIMELNEVLKDLQLKMSKLKTENLELLQEAKSVRAYRDELDIVNDKVKRLEKFEAENVKLRERLIEFEFLKARVEELRADNSLLLEAKQELEEQQLANEKRLEGIVSLEREVVKYRQQYETISTDFKVEHQKLQELAEENAHLRIEKFQSSSSKSSSDDCSSFQSHKTYSGSSSSLSDQLSETASSKLLRLELENQRLKKRLSEAGGDSVQDASKLCELENENMRLKKKLELLNMVKMQEIRAATSDLERANQELRLEKEELEESTREILNGLRLQLEELEQDKEQLNAIAMCAEERLHDVTDGSLKDLENENKQLRSRISEAGLQISRLESECKQLRVSTERTNTELTKRIDSLEKDKLRLAEENEDARDAVSQLGKANDKCDELVQTCKTLEEENKVLNERLKSLTENLEVSSSTVAGLQRDRDNLTSKVKVLEATLESLKVAAEKLAKMEAEHIHASEYTQHLRSCLTLTQSEKRAVEMELAALREERELLHKQLNTAISHQESLQSNNDELDSRNKELEQLINSLHTTEEKLENFTQDCVSLQDENAALREVNMTANTERTSLRMELEAMRSELVELRAKLSKMEIAYKTLKRTAQRDAKPDEQRSVSAERELDELLKEQSIVRRSASTIGMGTYQTISGSKMFNGYSSREQNNFEETLLELKNVLVISERRNENLEGEVRTLHNSITILQEKLLHSDQLCSQLNSELSLAHAQNITLQAQHDKFQAEVESTYPQTASIISHNASLRAELLRLEEQLGHSYSRIEHASSSNSEPTFDELYEKNEELTKELEMLKSKNASLKIKAVTLEVELAAVKEQYNCAVKEQQHTATLGSAVQKIATTKNDDGKMTTENGGCAAGLSVTGGGDGKLREEFVELSTRFKCTNDELNHLKKKYEESQDAMHAYREQWTAVDVENHGLTEKCETLLQTTERLEDERQMLMMQMQQLMNQNQELLVQIINGKDQIAEDQRTYLQRLADLRRQKEKLEEKIMEQYKTGSSKKKSKGFGATIVEKARNIMSRSRSKERRKTTSDLGLSLATDGDLSFDGGSNRSKTSRRGSDKISTPSSKSTPPVKSDSTEEIISLDQFLEELDQCSPAKRELLKDKNRGGSGAGSGGRAGGFGEGLSTPSSAGKQRGSLLTVFSSSSNHRPAPTPPTPSGDLNRLRMFRSEMNLSSSPLNTPPAPYPKARAPLPPLPSPPQETENHDATYQSFDEDELKNVLHPLPEATKNLSEECIPSKMQYENNHNFVRHVTDVDAVLRSSPLDEFRNIEGEPFCNDAKFAFGNPTYGIWDAYRINSSAQQRVSTSSSSTPRSQSPWNNSNCNYGNGSSGNSERGGNTQNVEEWQNGHRESGDSKNGFCNGNRNNSNSNFGVMKSDRNNLKNSLSSSQSNASNINRQPSTPNSPLDKQSSNRSLVPETRPINQCAGLDRLASNQNSVSQSQTVQLIEPIPRESKVCI